MSNVPFTERYLFVLLHDNHYALLLADVQDMVPARTFEDDWVRLKTITQLREALELRDKELAADEVTHAVLVYDSEMAKSASELIRTGSGLRALHWRILGWDGVFGGLGGVFEYPRPPLEDMVHAPLLALIAAQTGNAQSSVPAVAPAASLPPEPLLTPPSEELLLTFLPVLYQHAFTVLNGADLANLIGRVEPFAIPSPYPELSRDVLHAKQRAFHALPQEQQVKIVRFAQSVSKRLQARQEMLELIQSLEG